MELYKDENLFREAILSTSNKLNISQSIIEKDYFVTLLLKKINQRIPGILFKGGTCLSKCFKLINRFSEDIDLTLDESHFTQSNKRKANKEIVNICDDLGFKIINRIESIKHSHGSFNCYEIAYPHNYQIGDLHPYIKIELVFIQKAFPKISRPVSSLIYEALSTKQNKKIFEEYGLEEFVMNAQTIERTFVDKVFAICDYYLEKVSLRQSRHIYDIHKLFDYVDKHDLKILINDVRKERSKNKKCLSAAFGMNVSKIINDFINESFFKNDYEAVTLSLLNNPIKYDDAISTLKEIADSKLFD